MGRLECLHRLFVLAGIEAAAERERAKRNGRLVTNPRGGKETLEMILPPFRRTLRRLRFELR